MVPPLHFCKKRKKKKKNFWNLFKEPSHISSNPHSFWFLICLAIINLNSDGVLRGLDQVWKVVYAFIIGTNPVNYQSLKIDQQECLFALFSDGFSVEWSPKSTWSRLSQQNLPRVWVLQSWQGDQKWSRGSLRIVHVHMVMEMWTCVLITTEIARLVCNLCSETSVWEKANGWSHWL